MYGDGIGKFSRFVIPAFLALALGSAPSRAAGPEGAHQGSLQSEFLFGVQEHLGAGVKYGYQPEETNKEIEYFPFNTYRDDLNWEVADVTGDADFEAKFPRIAYALGHNPGKPVLILGSGPPLAEKGQPTDEAAREVYAEHAVKTAQLLRKYHPFYEIWNEWNLGAWNVNRVKGAPETYVDLVKQTYPKLKAEVPESTILAGAIGEDPDWKWTAAALKAGLLHSADGLSVHLYNHCYRPPQRTADNFVEKLKSLNALVEAEVGPGNAKIYISEYGWPTVDKVCGGVPAPDAANNFVQFVIMATAYPWIKGAWIYELKDHNTGDPDRENNFGLYKSDGSEKIAVCYLKKTWDFIKDYRRPEAFGGRDDVGAYAFLNDSKTAHLAVWLKSSAKLPVKMTLPKEAKVTEYCDPSSVGKAGNALTLGGKPLLVELPAEKVKEVRFD